MASHSARGVCYRTSTTKSALFASLIVSVACSPLLAHAKSSASTLPSCHDFSRAAKRLSGDLGLYVWPDKLSLPNSRLPQWTPVDVRMYEDKLQRVFDGDNPLLTNPFVHLHKTMGKKFFVKSHISEQLKHGWVKTSAATFSLSGPHTKVTMLRFDILYDKIGTLRQNPIHESKAQFQRSYVVLNSESNPSYDGYPIDPTGAAQNTSLSILLFGSYAYWIDASNGDVYLIKGDKRFVSNIICERTVLDVDHKR